MLRIENIIDFRINPEAYKRNKSKLNTKTQEFIDLYMTNDSGEIVSTFAEADKMAADTLTLGHLLKYKDMKQKLLTRIDFNLICAEGQGNTYAERTHAQYIAALVTNEIFLPIDAQDLKFGIEQSDQLFATGLIEWKVTDNGTDLIHSGASRFGQWFRSAVREVTPIFSTTDIKIFGSKR